MATTTTTERGTPKRFLDTNEVAQLTHCAPFTARKLMRDGKIRAAKVGKGWIALEADVLAYVDSIASAPAAEGTTRRRRRRS